MSGWTIEGDAEVGRIVITGRRADAGHFAELVSARLRPAFGYARVSTSVDAAQPVGAPHARRCAALVLLIGPHFLRETDPRDGGRRIDALDDPVRGQIEAAIALGTPIFPVLIDDTPALRAEDVPRPLRRLAQLSPRRIAGARIDSDVARLAPALAAALQTAPRPTPAPAKPGSSTPIVPRAKRTPKRRIEKAFEPGRLRRAAVSRRAAKVEQGRIAVWLGFLAIVGAPIAISWLLHG